jgi:hypothetical protein
MTTIETTIEVDEQGKATIQLPAGLKPGAYWAVVVLQNQEPAEGGRARPDLSAHGAGPSLEGCAVCGEEIPQAPPQGRSVLEFLDALPPGPRSAPTWDEIERRFQEERDAWDR